MMITLEKLEKLANVDAFDGTIKNHNGRVLASIMEMIKGAGGYVKLQTLSMPPDYIYKAYGPHSELSLRLYALYVKDYQDIPLKDITGQMERDAMIQDGGR